MASLSVGATTAMTRPYCLRGLFTQLAGSDDCSQIGLPCDEGFDKQLRHLSENVYSPILDHTVTNDGRSVLRLAWQAGSLVDVLNTGPCELAIGQEVALLPPFVASVRYEITEQTGAIGARRRFSFPLTVPCREAEKACLFYSALKMASIGCTPDKSVLLEYLSPRLGDWAEPVAEAVTAEEADVYRCEPAQLNRLCDVAEGLHALLPLLNSWLVSALGDDQRSTDSALRLQKAVGRIWPSVGQNPTDQSPDASYGLITDLFGSLLSWKSGLELKPVGRVHRKMTTNSSAVAPGEPFEILLYR